MLASALRALALAAWAAAAAAAGSQQALGSAEERARYQAACPGYSTYAVASHPPLSSGPLKLPYQRPHAKCRTFSSRWVEQVISDVTGRMPDADLARLFENAFPNTLDTTISWHDDGLQRKAEAEAEAGAYGGGDWSGAHTFVVTGDITAEWLRDSTNQLQNYQGLAAHDPALRRLIAGAIATQAEFVIASPYCNAFQPPPPAKLPASGDGLGDEVHPAYEHEVVFECKYELDSLAHFLRLGNEFRAATGSSAFVTDRWLQAVEAVMEVLAAQQAPTFNATTGKFRRNEYTFRRTTSSGSETLWLGGVGNPLAGGTGLARSAFRPSDDATILPLLVPANAMMAVELRRAAVAVAAAGGRRMQALATAMSEAAAAMEEGVLRHAVVAHPRWGDVFAYEVDGYGGRIMMDDANLPSLLSLPLLGFVDHADPTYRNTRAMVLASEGNPYYLRGPAFSGVGGPHVGPHHAWPMSVLVQAMTSRDDAEIAWCLAAVKNASRHGLIHESVNVNSVSDITRPWFAWANSVFAQTILHLAAERPHLVFGDGAKPYKIKDVRLQS